MLDVFTLETAPKGVLPSFFELRHEVFNNRLGWNLPVEDGREHDQFDNSDAVYITIKNDFNHVVAGARLLPTSVPNLLSDVFPFLVEGEVPRSPAIYEVTRVAVDHRRERLTPLFRIANTMGVSKPNVAGMLFSAIFEFGIKANLTNLVSVSCTRMERILKRSGWNIRRLGQVHRINEIDVVGEDSDVTMANLMSIRSKARIVGPILSDCAIEAVIGRSAEAA